MQSSFVGDFQTKGAIYNLTADETIYMTCVAINLLGDKADLRGLILTNTSSICMSWEDPDTY